MLQPKMMIVKNSDFRNSSRISLKKWTFSSTFPIPPKNPGQFKEFQNHWAPWNSMYWTACVPLVICHPSSQLRVPPSYFRDMSRMVCFSLRSSFLVFEIILPDLQSMWLIFISTEFKTKPRNSISWPGLILLGEL